MSVLQQFLKASTEEYTDKVAEELDIEVPEVQPVSEDDEYQADEHLDEADEEVREVEVAMEQFAMMSQEVDERVASIENFTEVLSIGIEQAQFSPQFAGLVHEQLNDYKRLFGDDLSVPSLEDHNHENLNEFYATSLEGFGDVVAKLKASVASASAKISQKIKDIGSNEKRASAFTVKADALLEKLSGADFSEAVTVKTNGLKRLNLNGTFPSDIKAAIATDQRSVHTLTKTYIPALTAYSIKVNEHAYAAAMQDVSNSIKAVVALKHPSNTVAAGIRDGSQLLGRKLKSISITAKDSDAATAKHIVEELSRVEEPFENTTTSDKGDVKLTKDQVTALLSAVKIYAEQLKTLSSDAGTALTKQAKDLNSTIGKVKTDSKELKQLAADANTLGTAAKISAFSPSMTYLELSLDIYQVAGDVLKLAERAVGKAGKSKATAKDDE